MSYHQHLAPSQDGSLHAFQQHEAILYPNPHNVLMQAQPGQNYVQNYGQFQTPTVRGSPMTGSSQPLSQPSATTPFVAGTANLTPQPPTQTVQSQVAQRPAHRATTTTRSTQPPRAAQSTSAAPPQRVTRSLEPPGPIPPDPAPGLPSAQLGTEQMVRRKLTLALREQPNVRRMHQSQGRQGIACGEGNSKAWVTDPGSTSKKLFHTYGIARSTAGIRSKPKYDQFSIRLDPLPGPFHQWCKADEDRLGLLEWIRQHRELEDAPLNDPDCRYVAGRQDVAERYVRFLSADAERKNSPMPRREDLQRRAEQNVRHGFPFIKDMRGDLGNNTWTDACNQSRWLPPDLLRDGMWVQVVHTIEVSNAKKRIGERWVPRDWHVKVHLYSIHVINEPFVPEVAELYTLSGFEYRPPSPEPATAAVSSGNASAPGASSNPAMDIVSSGSSKSWSTPVPPQDTDGDFDEEDIDDDAMMSTTTAKGKGKGKAKAIEMNDTDDFPSYDTPGMSQQSYNLPSRQNSPFGSPTPHQTPGSSTGIRLGGF